MYLRHGTFCYLPPLTDEQIAAQVRYALLNSWPVSIEYTDDPHPRNAYWEMWGLPLFDLDAHNLDLEIVRRQVEPAAGCGPGHARTVRAAGTLPKPRLPLDEREATWPAAARCRGGR